MPVKYIVVVRDPREVAASLAERDALSVDHSFALWLKYNLIVERDTRLAPRFLMSYDELMRDWKTTMRCCSSTLDLRLTFDDAAASAVAAFLSPELQHHRAAAVAMPPPTAQLAEWTHRTYEIMRQGRLAPSTAREFDRLLGEYARRGRSSSYALVCALTGASLSA
jgi:hypothetical protein